MTKSELLDQDGTETQTTLSNNDYSAEALLLYGPDRRRFNKTKIFGIIAGVMAVGSLFYFSGEKRGDIFGDWPKADKNFYEQAQANYRSMYQNLYNASDPTSRFEMTFINGARDEIEVRASNGKGILGFIAKKYSKQHSILLNNHGNCLAGTAYDTTFETHPADGTPETGQESPHAIATFFGKPKDGKQVVVVSPNHEADPSSKPLVLFDTGKLDEMSAANLPTLSILIGHHCFSLADIKTKQ